MTPNNIFIYRMSNKEYRLSEIKLFKTFSNTSTLLNLFQSSIFGLIFLFILFASLRLIFFISQKISICCFSVLKITLWWRWMVLYQDCLRYVLNRCNFFFFYAISTNFVLITFLHKGFYRPLCLFDKDNCGSKSFIRCINKWFVIVLNLKNANLTTNKKSKSEKVYFDTVGRNSGIFFFFYFIYKYWLDLFATSIFKFR